MLCYYCIGVCFFIYVLVQPCILSVPHLLDAGLNTCSCLMQRQCKSRAEPSLLGLCRVQPILCKDSANREQNHQSCLSVMPRCSLSYAKIVNLYKTTKKKTEICLFLSLLFHNFRKITLCVGTLTHTEWITLVAWTTSLLVLSRQKFWRYSQRRGHIGCRTVFVTCVRNVSDDGSFASLTTVQR